MGRLHRPYIRKAVREEVVSRAPRDDQGRFRDANTGKSITGNYDLGHKAGNEFWREREAAEAEGLTQAEFNDRMNNPDYYQIEDPSENRSHVHEQKDGRTVGGNGMGERIDEQKYEEMISALHAFASNVIVLSSEMDSLALVCISAISEEDKGAETIKQSIHDVTLKYSDAAEQARAIAAAMQEELDEQRKEDAVWNSDDNGE